MPGRYKLFFIAMMIGALVAIAACGQSEEKEAIIFSDLNWTSAQFQNRVAQYIVEEGYGYPTEVVFGSTVPLFQGLRRGDTHVTMEIWLPNQDEVWRDASVAGEVVPIGESLGRDWQSAFAIPAYLQEQYPELDSVGRPQGRQIQGIVRLSRKRAERPAWYPASSAGPANWSTPSR